LLKQHRTYPAMLARLSGGKVSTTEHACRRWLRSNPQDAFAWHFLGVVLASAGRQEEACTYLEKAVISDDREPRWFFDLGLTYASRGLWTQARSAFARAHSADPGKTEFACRHAEAILECGDVDAASDAFLLLLRDRNACAAAMCGLARVSRTKGEFGPAERWLKRALRRSPELVQAHRDLASIYVGQLRPERAIPHLKFIERRKPGDREIPFRIGDSCWNLGDLEQAVRYYRKAFRECGEPQTGGSRALTARIYQPGETSRSILGAFSRWADRYMPAVRKVPHRVRKDPSRKLRIAYLSGEFLIVPAYYFVMPLLQNRDAGNFEVYCYDCGCYRDRRTDEYRRDADYWREVRDRSDEQIYRMIREDEIDILVDLSGHFDFNRLTVFALRPAPIQFTFPNYPCTTGLSTIDYIFTDRWVDPPGAARQYAEKAWHLPSGYLAYIPVEGAPDVEPAPVERNGYITFGIFQKPGKLNSGVWDCIAGAMLKVPGSRLLVQYPSGDLDDRRSVSCGKLLQELKSRGVAGQRVEFRGRLDLMESVAIKREVDIAFDTFPYNGQTTTCETLWMGVPVVTLRGDYHVARIGHEILSRIGMEDWVADSPADYVRIAARHAKNPEELVRLRFGLRERVRAALEPARLSREVHNAYREAWRIYCSKEGSRRK
jgi:tetratricopeptide (TPR) repeat protein